jgi:hypothetical protein
VVETKIFNYWSQNLLRDTWIIEKKAKVKAQAEKYGTAWAKRHSGQQVYYFAVINDKSNKPLVIH